MLKHRIIPIVLLDGYSVVKTIQFDTRRNLGNPITVARVYNSRNVDELVLLDIDASKHGEKIDAFTITEVASECFMPLTVGGGIRSCSDISQLLESGADKVVLNTITLDNSEFITEASNQFGSQCIVVSIDVRKTDDGQYAIYSHAGRHVECYLFDWIKRVESLGAGEIILNSVDRDGSMLGFDLELIEMASKCIKIPMIVAGGAKDPEDAVEAITRGASAVAAASIYHFTSITPDDVKAALFIADLPVRKGKTISKGCSKAM